MSIILKQEYVEQIKNDEALQGAIAKATGKSIQAPLRWAKSNAQDKLTMFSTLNAIRKYNGILNNELLVEEKVTA